MSDRDGRLQRQPAWWLPSVRQQRGAGKMPTMGGVKTGVESRGEKNIYLYIFTAKPLTLMYCGSKSSNFAGYEKCGDNVFH
jgi:hypothetical protein